MAQEDTRGLTVHFIDGTKMRFTGPKQAKDDWDAIRKMQLILDRPYLCLETEDSAMIIPTANIKYIESSAKPSSLPEFFSEAFTLSRIESDPMSLCMCRMAPKWLAVDSDRVC